MFSLLWKDRSYCNVSPSSFLASYYWFSCELNLLFILQIAEQSDGLSKEPKAKWLLPGDIRLWETWPSDISCEFCGLLVPSLVAQTVKNLPGMQDTQVQSLGQEDHLEKGMATHARILAWRIPWTEEPSRLQSMWVAKSRTRLSD